MKTLHTELRAAGASEEEARELAVLAGKLGKLKLAGTEVKGRRPRLLDWKYGLAFGSTAIVSLALGMLLVVASQTALPGSWLYPVQKMSDAAAVKAYPQYRADVMMKRAAQVKQLVAQHAGQQTVLNALADYQIEAVAYKSAGGNYAAFEYCEANLKQAASMATPSIRESIHHQLDSLDTV